MFPSLLVLHRMYNTYVDDGSCRHGVLAMCQSRAWSHLIISAPPEASAVKIPHSI